MAVRIRHADHVVPLYPQTLALTSPTSGGRLFGIVRSQTRATEFSLLYMSELDRVSSPLHNLKVYISAKFRFLI
jgi:hypothetical protein